MKDTFLSEIWASVRSGNPPFGVERSGEAYDRFLAALGSLPGSKMWIDIVHPDHLRTAPSLGLMLGDRVVLIGGGSADLQIDIAADPPNQITLQGGDGIPPGSTVIPAFLRFHPKVISPWMDEASELINSEQVIYAPRRGIVYLEREKADGRKEWRMDRLDPTSPWSVWRRVSDSERSGGTTVIMPDEPESGTQFDLLSVTMPFLTNTPPSVLFSVLRDEKDTVMAFRAALRKAIAEAAVEIKGTDDRASLTRRGTEIRDDIIRPETERLERRFKTLVRTHALRIGGAGLGTIVLSLAAVPTTGLLALLGAGGVGVLANEYAAYRKEMDELKENPWYFAWRLRKKLSRTSKG